MTAFNEAFLKVIEQAITRKTNERCSQSGLLIDISDHLSHALYQQLHDTIPQFNEKSKIHLVPENLRFINLASGGYRERPLLRLPDKPQPLPGLKNKFKRIIGKILKEPELGYTKPEPEINNAMTYGFQNLRLEPRAFRCIPGLVVYMHCVYHPGNDTLYLGQISFYEDKHDMRFLEWCETRRYDS